MNRCPTHQNHLFHKVRPHLLLAWALAAALLPMQARAQDIAAQVQTQNEAALGGRNFPVGTLRGRMAFGVFPEVELDGKAERLAPGARIRDPRNLLVVPSAVGGQYLAVNYRRDAAGMVNDVWILTPDEASGARASAGGTPFLNFWPFISRGANE